MPSDIQTISKVLPLTYFSEGLKYSMLYKYPEGIFTKMAILAVLAIVFLIIGARITRWKAK
jgi:ABC-type multidrug transport system permease subunit